MGFTIDVGIPKFLETAYKNAGMWTTLKAVRRTAPCELQSSLVDDNLLLRPHLDDGHHEHPGRAGDSFLLSLFPWFNEEKDLKPMGSHDILP